MPRLLPCWSCGAQDRECFAECECAKCVDPEDYEQWKCDSPEEYSDWLESQKIANLEPWEIED
jgi:hypothetical protein